jgi:hypothetical protein
MYFSKTFIFLVATSVTILVLITCNRCGRSQQAQVTPGDDLIDTSSWITDGGDIASSLKGSEEAFGRPDPKVLDSLARVYKTKEKNLFEYIIALEHSVASLKAIPGTQHHTLEKSGDEVDLGEPDDSGFHISNVYEEFSNPYYRAQVQIGDSSYMKVQHFDTLTAVWKTGHTGWLFNRKGYLQLDLSSADTSNRIYGIKAYRRYVRPKKWSISVFAGYGYSLDLRRSWFGGVGISRDLIRF